MTTRLSTLLFTTLLILAACTPRDSAGPVGPAKNDPFAGNGTITSGGGNGINGRMTEMYQKDIETLTEYRRYIFPILRKLSKGEGDVLVAYLQWTAKSKVWYFVPRKLQSLPADRVALAFTSTDQLALHSEKEIFIDEPAYLERSDIEKAYLLLHEMVMGAKLLMKKSPEVQCQILSGISAPLACRDKVTMALAITAPTLSDRESATLLNGRDHESVRAMTVYLADSKKPTDVSSLAAIRQRLDFHFPWDHLASRVKMSDLQEAIERTQLAQTKFKTLKSFASEDGQPCYSRLTGIGYYHFGLGANPPSEYWNQNSLQVMLWQNRFRDLPMKSVGVPYPLGSKEIADEVQVELGDFANEGVTNTITNHPSLRLQFFMSRDPNPVLLEYRLTPITIRHSKQSLYGTGFVEREEIVIRDLLPFRCVAY